MRSLAMLVLSFLTLPGQGSVSIAGVFSKSDHMMASAFIDSVKTANQMTMMKYATTEFEAIEALVVTFDQQNKHSIRTAVSAAANRVVSAVIGPADSASSSLVEHFVTQAGLAFLGITADTQNDATEYGGMSLFMKPHFDDVIHAITELAVRWGWTNLLLVYRCDEDILQLQSLLTAHELNHVKIKTIRSNGDYSSMLRTIKESAFDRIALKIPRADISLFLDEAMQHGMVSEDFHYIIADTVMNGFAVIFGIYVDRIQADACDMFPLKKGGQRKLCRYTLNFVRNLPDFELKHTFLFWFLDMLEIDLQNFKYNNGRITGFQLIPNVTRHHDVVLTRARSRYVESGHFPASDVAGLRDGIVALSEAIQTNDLAAVGQLHFNSKTMSYNSVTVMNNSKLILRRMRDSGPRNGLLGPFRFDGRGVRLGKALDVYQLTYDGSTSRIGYWQRGRGFINSTEKPDSWYSGEAPAEKTPHHFRVTTILEPPYVMRSELETATEGNSQFIGFCVELLESLSKDLKFTYTIQLVKDGRYGDALTDNLTTWDGMIGEILRDEADLAVAPLTDSYKRSDVLDFTQPFLQLGLSILFKYPEPKNPNMMSFLFPLSASVWGSIVATIIFVMLLLYAVARVSPYEWFTPPSCANTSGHRRKRRQVKVNNYNVQNTVWFIASTLLKGGCDFGPKATSTRIIGGCWWTFTLVLASAYTANLAAVLTVDRRWLPIRSLEDLGDQDEIQYGALDGGSTMQFFEESMIPSHHKIWTYMNQHPELWVSSNQEGVDRVVRGHYAYIMESPSLEYAVNTNCNLTQVGGVLGSKHYGIAAKKGSNWIDKMTKKILEYSEHHVIDQLKKRWWERAPKPCNMVKAASMKEGRIPMGMANVAGTFVILLLGLFLALAVAIFEYYSHYPVSWKRSGGFAYRAGALRESGSGFARCSDSQNPRIWRQCSSCRVSLGIRKSSSVESKI